jgi:phosphoglycerate dehydrogenase-like enzyme
MDYKALCNMKPSAYLVNISREKIVNFEDLKRALKEGKIKGVAIDTFENEPITNAEIFNDIPNLIVTPHIGYVSLRNYHLYYKEIVEDIEAFLSNKPIRLLT